MCTPVICPTCQKTTWAGCGDHIEEALAEIPENQRCYGHEETQAGRLQAKNPSGSNSADLRDSAPRLNSLRTKLSRIFPGK